MLKHTSKLYLFRSQEAKDIEDHLRKELRDAKNKVSNVHEEIEVKCNEIEILQDKVLCFKHENNLIEGKIVTKTEEISSLKEQSKYKKLE